LLNIHQCLVFIYLLLFSSLTIKIGKKRNESKIPLQEPVIELQFPFKSDREHVLETVPLYPFKQFPFAICPIANVSSHSAFPSFEIYGQFMASYCYKFDSEYI